MPYSFKINDLASINVIAQTRSLSKSAVLLNVSQPNLSRAITVIEENIGLKIFDRSVRPLQLTEFGKELLSYILLHIHSHTALSDFVEHYKQSSNGNVRIQAPTGQLVFISRYVIPIIKKNHPELKIELTTSNLLDNEYISGASFDSACDILFTHTLPKNEELIAIKIASMKADIYGVKSFIQNHPIINLTDYCHHPCVLFHSFMNDRENIWSFTDTHNDKDVHISIAGDYVCDNAYTGLELARGGMGYIYVPDIFIREMDCSSILFPTLPKRYLSTVTNYMIYHKRSHQPYRVEVVIRIINEIISDVINAFNNLSGDVPE